MVEINSQDQDPDQLLEKIEEELKLQRRRAKAGKHRVMPKGLGFNDPYSWSQLDHTLDTLKHNVNVGVEITRLTHYRGFGKRFVRFVGKLAGFLGRITTIRQRNFNNNLLHALCITLDGIQGTNRDAALFERQVKEQLEEQSALIDYLKNALVHQERQVAILLEELNKKEGNAVSDPESQTSQISRFDVLDPLYLAFENKFRGSRADIIERLMVYVPIVRDAGAGEAGSEILDIGCGRGEWLEILKDEGLFASGLDLNTVLVERCREEGYKVEQNDAISHLRSLPDNSLGAITAFHLLEHLELEDRVALLDESVRVLKPGGVAIFETPNPRNLLVGACNFWSDPTHKRPLYPETQQFFMEHRGFSNVKLMFLHPHAEDQRLPEEEAPQLASHLNDVFSCARDYAVVGYKV